MGLFTLITFLLWILTIITIISIVTSYFIYKYTINKFSKNYDELIKILQNVKNNDLYFMNFGYWEDEHLSLTNANKKFKRIA